ncbi:hypothetical protein E2562_029953 [Oryza meyeriana var. granulata]|uniref:Uncharacterized protein n=1 Tax=Oryza meyeriana var. granulata TaxID=110450 RepID=A0A6G1CVD7_9ORYZ|nr:hypothetical protein E2562_029953 [Oryza meyeriana var. granulata]
MGGGCISVPSFGPKSDMGSGNLMMKKVKHTQQKHPDSRPSEIDPARQVDWENFQQSSDIVDVLSTIHAQVPNGIVLGDYVIEYGDDETGEEYEVFRRES